MLKSEFSVAQFKEYMDLCSLSASHDHKVWDTLDKMDSQFKAYCLGFAETWVYSSPMTDDELVQKLDVLQSVIDNLREIDDELACSWAELNDLGDVRWDPSHAERYSQLIKTSKLTELDTNQRDFAHMVTRTKLPHSIERPMELDLQVFALQELPNLKPEELEDKWDGEVYQSYFWSCRQYPVEKEVDEFTFMDDIIDC